MTTTAPPIASDPTDFPTKGRVSRRSGDAVILYPTGTNYELHLKVSTPDGRAGLIESDRPALGFVRVKGRKVYTVGSGGGFIVPILGTPRIVQGRVRALTETHALVQAGANVLVELPEADHAYDLAAGPITVGRMINVTILPGAEYEPLPATAAETAFAESYIGEKHDSSPPGAAAPTRG